MFYKILKKSFLIVNVKVSEHNYVQWTSFSAVELWNALALMRVIMPDLNGYADNRLLC